MIGLSSRSYKSSQQSQSPFHFFQLPREVRDNIYEFAFGNDEHQFNYRGLKIAATTTNPNTHSTCLQGLPEWILASRSTCTEAIETFHRTRAFSPRTREFGKTDAVPNALVLHSNAIRNIELCYVSCAYVRLGDARHDVPPRMFLAYLQPFLASDLNLKLDWSESRCHFCGNRGEYNSVSEHVQNYENWGRTWVGCFKQVVIDLTTCQMSAQGLEDLRMRFEARSKRLVGCAETDEEGGGVQVRWGTEVWSVDATPRASSRGSPVQFMEQWLIVWRRV